MAKKTKVTPNEILKILSLPKYKPKADTNEMIIIACIIVGAKKASCNQFMSCLFLLATKIKYKSFHYSENGIKCNPQLHPM